MIHRTKTGGDLLKAITEWQPMATLIACGIKTIETRSWAPPASLIGQRIAIHAAKREITRENLAILARAGKSELDIPYGAVVATAVLGDAIQVEDNDGETVVGCYLSSGCLSDEIPIDPHGDFSVGRWLWLLDDIEPIDPPIPATGRQRIWNWENE